MAAVAVGGTAAPDSWVIRFSGWNFAVCCGRREQSASRAGWQQEHALLQNIPLPFTPLHPLVYTLNNLIPVLYGIDYA